MKVLLLNLYYPPDTSATARVAAAFIEPSAQKHDLTVICGRPSYDPVERRPWRLWQSEQQNGVCVVRVGSTDYPRTQMTRRVFNYLSYVALSVPRALFISCDVVLAMTDPPFEGIVGAFVAMLKRKPFVYNIRDMYPDMAVGGSIVKPGLMARIWEKLHRWALRRATRVVVLGEDMKARIAAKGVVPDRIDIVRDGVESSASSAAASDFDPEVIRAIRGDSRFVLLHAGNLGFYGAWETLLAAARELQSDDVSLVFVGDGAQRVRLQELAANTQNVRFLPFFPPSKVFSVLAAADAHVITIKRGLEGVVVPSKMYGILAAGRPIVAIAPKETDAATLGAREKFGCAADPDKIDEVVTVVKRLIADPQRVAAMGAAARSAAARYVRSTQIEKFAAILESAVRR
ncbi:MAG: glycosyltransferase family 4 protein [Acidobacteria bacterium]|nr:glycosyltransferase family 4 protein [Acidobacteriota bacterium]